MIKTIRITITTCLQRIVLNVYISIFVLSLQHILLDVISTKKDTKITAKRTNGYETVGCVLIYITVVVFYIIIRLLSRSGQKSNLIKLHFRFAQGFNSITKTLFNYRVVIEIINFFVLLWLIIFLNLRSILVYNINNYIYTYLDP
jgi:hypothetical protein